MQGNKHGRDREKSIIHAITLLDFNVSKALIGLALRSYS